MTFLPSALPSALTYFITVHNLYYAIQGLRRNTVEKPVLQKAVNKYTENKQRGWYTQKRQRSKTIQTNALHSGDLESPGKASDIAKFRGWRKRAWLELNNKLGF